MKEIVGILPALLTPFDKNNKINFGSLAKEVKLNNQKGVHGFYVGGSTGEGMMMTVEERISTFKCVAEANEGKAALIGHVGTINTDMAIEMGKACREFGYDCISAVAPYYYGFSKDAIKGYYDDIVKAVNMPMVVYNFPNSGGFSFTPEYANTMFNEDERYVAIKHTSQDLYTLQRFKQMDRKIVVYNGYDEMLVAGLSMGADGGIGSTYNFMAEKYLAIYNAFNCGDIKLAQQIQNEANEIIAELIKYGVFNMEKQILTEMGIDMGSCRKPFLPLSKEGILSAKAIAKSLAN